MSLTARDIAEITRLLEDSSFDELQLEIDGLKIHLRRSGAPVTAADGSIVAAVSISGPIDRMSRQPGKRFGTLVVAAAADVAELLA